MKINMRTIQQALNIGQRVYREWNKYQNKKNREAARQQGKTGTPAGYTQPKTGGQGNFGSFGTPAEQAQSTAQNQTFTNPYAKSSPQQPSDYRSSGAAAGGSWQNGGYPGDFFGSVAFDYSPEMDGEADPGEVVWAWVPFEEDYSQGKDRPVLVIGRDGDYLLALMLTSKDRNNVANSNPNYLDIGSGVWDKEGRDSEVKLDRVIRLNAAGIRREGAIMPQSTFDYIAQAYRQR